MKIKCPYFWLGVGLGVLWTLADAYGMTADNAAPKCATAIDDRLRDPASAEYQWGEREVIPSKKGFVVMLPVRASNAYGGKVTKQFVCRIEGDRVTEVDEIR